MYVRVWDGGSLYITIKKVILTYFSSIPNNMIKSIRYFKGDIGFGDMIYRIKEDYIPCVEVWNDKERLFKRIEFIDYNSTLNANSYINMINIRNKIKSQMIEVTEKELMVLTI